MLVDNPESAVRYADPEEKPEVMGDGKATFLEPMTDEEYATWVHEEEKGWGKVYRKFNELMNGKYE